MKKRLWLIMALLFALQIHAQMQIEAETVIVNREATNQETKKKGVVGRCRGAQSDHEGGPQDA